MSDQIREIIAFEGVDDNDVLEKYQPFVSLIFALTGGGRFNLGDISTSHSGEFSAEYLAAYKDYMENDDTVIDGIGSPGLGYSEHTLDAMREADFNTGPAIVMRLKYHHENWSNGYPSSTDLIEHPLSHVKEHFEQFGLSCFIAQGRSLPDDYIQNALVFDVADPDFLRKIKPDFMTYFVPREAASLSNPMHMDNAELKAGYCYAVMHKLRAYAEEIDADFGPAVAYDEMLPRITYDIPDACDRQADYHLKFAIRAMDAMLPVLSPAERGSVILQLASQLAGREFDPDADVADDPRLGHFDL